MIRILSRFLSGTQGFLSLFVLSNVDVLDQNSGKAVAQESRDLAYEPALFVGGMARIFQRVLFASTLQNGPDTGGELSGLCSLGADRPVA